MKEKKIEALALSKIEAGETFVKVLPENIGRLQFYCTTNPKEPEHTPKYYAIRRAFIIIPTLVIIALAWYFGGGDALMLAGFIGFFVICFAILMNGFRATDYFVGDKGFAYYMLNKDRNTVIEKKEVLFDDIDYILHREARIYEPNGKYKESRFFLGLVSQKGKEYNVIHKIKGVYDKDIYESYDSLNWYIDNELEINEPVAKITEDYKFAEYDFVNALEKELLTKLINRNLGEYQNSGVASFPLIDGHNYYLYDILAYSNGDVKIDKQLMKKEDINKIKIQDGVLTIVYKNEKGKSRNVAITRGDVGNHDALLRLLNRNHKLEE